MANEDKATRYQRLRRRATVAGVLAVALVLALAQFLGPPGPSGPMVSGETAGLPSQLGSLALAAFGLIAVAVGVTFPSAFYRDALLTRHYGL